MTSWLVSLLFLFSGATALTYQVAWSRSLSLIFGASYLAVSIVLASFMGGLALGGWVLGRRAERLQRPLRVYGWLELGVALAAALLPLMLLLVNRFYVALAMQTDGITGWLSVCRIVMAFGVLVVPTFFMGGTLPILTRYVVRTSKQFGPRLAWLYGVNTAGAVTGALLAGFVLLPHLGVWKTQWVAIGLNVLIGLCAILADRRLGAPFRSSAIRSKPKDEFQVAKRPEAPLALSLAYWGTLVSGMCALSLEVMWTRGIGMAMGTTTYSFTIILASFLTGITIGSTIQALLPLRRVPVAVQFGLALAAIGVTGMIVSQNIPRLPQLAVQLNLSLYGGSLGVRAATTLLLSFAVMLPSAIFMGIAFPLAGRARLQLKKQFGRSVGDLISINTLGGIAGPILAGFVLIPMLGLQKSMLLVCALDLGYGLCVLAAYLGSRHSRFRGLALTLGLMSLALIVVVPKALPKWDLQILGAFQNNVTLGYANKDGKVDVSLALANTQVLYYGEGRGSTVSVAETDGYRAVLINGKSVATDYMTDLQHEYLLGHLPVLLHPNPKSALVIGLGAGLTLGGVVAHESLEQIKLVEIERAVLGAARIFGDVNGNALDDPRLQVVFQDGRNELLTSKQQYDVITADPIHPWAYGAAYLYTTEYYSTIAERLTERGVMCQWMPIYELSDENLRSIVATFAQSFAYTSIWQTAFDAVLIGSQAPLQVDLENLSQRLKQPRVARQLSRIGIADPLSFLAEFTMDDAGVRQYARGGQINTDDNLYLEFSSPLNIGSSNGPANMQRIDSYRVSPQALVSNVEGFPGGRPAWVRALQQVTNAKRATVKASIALESAVTSPELSAWKDVMRQLDEILAIAPNYGRARTMKAVALTGLARAEMNQSGGRERAAQSLNAALNLADDAHASYHLARIYLQQGNTQGGLDLLQRTLNRRARYPGARRLYGKVLAAAGRLDEAQRELLQVIQFNPQSPEARLDLANVLSRNHQVDAAADHYETALSLATAQKKPQLAAQIKAAASLNRR